MALNLTGIDENAYFWAISGVYIARFVLIAVPALVLCVLCVAALLIAKEINWQMRVILINIFAADVCYWLATAVQCLGFPVRARQEPDEMSSCVVYFSLTITSFLTKLAAVALYATMVYVFIKYGVRKLKWIAIIVYIAVSWTLVLSFAMMPYFRGSNLINNSGFCETNTADDTVVLIVVATVWTGIIFLCLCSILVFSILTYCYTKKNTISSDNTNGNPDVKLAIVRNLRYLAITSALILLLNLLHTIIPLIIVDNGVMFILILNSVLGVALDLLNAATHVAAFIILTPVRAATKGILKKVCFFRKTRRIVPMGTKANPQTI